MNLLHRFRHFAAGTLVAACALVSLPAAAQNYAFEQTGFDGGGRLSGTFSGVAGADGILTLDELTAFDLSFTLDSIVAPFALGKGDLAQFVYNANGGPLGDDVNEGVLDLGNTLFAGPAVTGLSNATLIGFEAFTISPGVISVSVVPEPSTTAFLLTGLVLLGVRSRLR